MCRPSGYIPFSALQSHESIICGADAFPGLVISVVAEDLAVVFTEDTAFDFVILAGDMDVD